MPEVIFQPIGKRVSVAAGSSLLDAARQAGIELTSSCGGEGRCGQCRIKILAGQVSRPSSAERLVLTEGELSEGTRLACRAQPIGDVTVYVPKDSLLTGSRLQLESSLQTAPIEPVVRAFAVEAPAPRIDDPRSDVGRIIDAIEQPGLFAESAVARQISQSARDYEWRMSAFARGSEIVGIAPYDQNPVGLAVDLGTTKIAAFLLDLATGEELAAAGASNPQIGYGEDIMSRLAYAQRETGGAQLLSEKIVETLNELLSDLAQQAGVQPTQITDSCIVGNTAMTHLLLQLPIDQLAAAPYVAATSSALDIKARDLALGMAPGAYVHILPSIGGFVGADHVAMILASGIDRAKRVTVGIDIGTNTEIVLAKPGTGFLTSASCASGPAFEGAHIVNGMRAASGAIEAVRLSDTGIHLKTIGGIAPVGLCGSGIIDTVAELRRWRIINQRGRFQKDNTRVRQGHLGSEMLLATAAESGSSHDIVITQQDVNAIQLAKGAIRAGLDILLQSTETPLDEVEEVIIAGAFGSFLSIESALEIGLLPRCPQAIYHQVGNAAAAGARRALVSRMERERARNIVKATRYLELMTYPDFSHHFALGMLFPKDDELRCFKSSL